jgi:hypothetical protein
MTRSRLGLLGLCAVVFGLMAFSTSAQATVGAHWWILDGSGNKIDAANLEAEVGLTKDSAVITLHAELSSGTKFLVLCTNLVAENIKLKANGSIGTGGKVKFTGCTVDLNGAAAPACTPTDAVGGAGTVVTKPGHGLIVLNTGGTASEVVLLLPDSGETFATLELGATCAVGSKVNVIGPHFVIRDCEGLFKSHIAKHLIEEEASGSVKTELWVISKTTEHIAKILGSAYAFLTGNHTGLLFGGEAA